MVVVVKVGIEWAMGIMTRDACDPRVGWVIASAIFKPIGLKADIADVVDASGKHVRRGSMTRSAKIIDVDGRQRGRIEDVVVFLAIS